METNTPPTPDQVVAAFGSLIDAWVDSEKYVYFAASEYGSLLVNTVSRTLKDARKKAVEYCGIPDDQLDRHGVSFRRLPREAIVFPIDKSEYLSGFKFDFDKHPTPPA